MPFTSTWVGGQAARAEPVLGSLENVAGQSHGWGTTFRAEESIAWFHIPLPTPVILPHRTRGQPDVGIRVSLSKAFVFYLIEGSVSLREVHLWDGHSGPLRIDLRNVFPAAPDLNLLGDLFLTEVRNFNNWAITPRKTIRFGLVISVFISFGQRAPNGSLPQITFGTIGADFEPEAGEDLLGPGTQTL
jgi:hypothetical protein